MAAYGFYFAHPWWLLTALAAGPLAWVALRCLRPLSKARRWAAIGLRILTVLLLALLLAGPTLTRTREGLTVVAVVDRSLSVPEPLQEAALDYLEQAVGGGRPDDRLAVVDVAERAHIGRLPTTERDIPRRNTALTGQGTHLADGVQMALAIAPPETASRIVLLSDGRETAGDIAAVADVAAANEVPIDVLPLQYRYEREVVMRRLSAPARARRGQTIPLRLILESTHEARGELTLTLNGSPIDLDPGSDRIGVDVRLTPGINAHTVSLPITDQGIHEFRGTFRPASPSDDSIAENNVASAVTIVGGPGRVMVVDGDGSDAGPLLGAISAGDIEAEYLAAEQVPDDLHRMLDFDAVVLVNTPAGLFSFAQQEMLATYVTELGGGLVMVGGPNAFGAGGWIGSPVAEVLPVDPDPPQKMQMPQGALVIVLDRSGSMFGEKLHICKLAARESVRMLSRQDYVGLVAFDSQTEWIVPLAPAEDKEAISERIMQIAAGGGTVIQPALVEAAEALEGVETAVKHVILLTDGITAGPDCRPVAARMAQRGITVSTVGVGHDAETVLLRDIANVASGRYYEVNDLQSIPQIFVKEAMMVRRSLIVEQEVVPVVTGSGHPIIEGLDRLPPLDGYVLTGAKGGLSRVLMTNEDGDPMLASTQAGLGRSVAFTSSATSRWAAGWIAWGGFNRFWEQAVRWSARPGESEDVEVHTDVDGRDVTVVVDAADAGEIMHMAGQVIAQDMSLRKLEPVQTGPGQYRASFTVDSGGSFVINLRYARAEGGTDGLAQAVVTVPFSVEFESLTDNTPLLAEIAAATGGRVLSPEPGEADLFDRSGLSFPHVARSLTRPLMIAWLAVFLLDVAVRRLAVDFRAAFGRTWRLLTAWRRGRQGDDSVDRLRAASRKWRRQLRVTASPHARRRYRAPEGADDELPLAVPKSDQPAEHQPPEPEQPERAESPQKPETHVDQLLRAKRGNRPQDDASQQD